ncbi:MAG TPA: C25 family cysteine peptidase, partial [Gemmataceae bacterium]|nr:C25 family cysteine peptidase [Gemmataceae bacterium]
GGVGVIGSSTRVFSGSGGAFTLAFFDSLGYEHQTVGGAMRHAKNFLLAYSLLKEKRLGNSAKLGAANVRTAWAFTLWGDPTLRLPAPLPPGNALPGVHHRVHGHTIILDVPETPEPKAITAKYSAQIVPNGRLAGLVNKEPDEHGKQLKGLVFAEVHLPKAPAGKTPLLHSRVPSRRWVFCWDERRATGYLLLLPRPKDRGELHFHIEWTPQETVQGVVRDKVGGEW